MFLEHVGGRAAQDGVTFLIECLEQKVEGLTHDESCLYHVGVVAQRQDLLHNSDVEPKQFLVVF